MKPTEPSLSARSARALGAEQRDRSERDAALTDDDALVAYEAKWQRRLGKLQRAFPARWRVAGLSDEEVRDLLTLRLLEAVRRADSEALALARPGREWGLLIAQRELRALRKGFRLNVVLADQGEGRLPSRGPNQEDAWLDHEATRSRCLAQARAEQGLSAPQRRWLGAFRASAEQGAFFEASAEPNLSEASRALGKHRSSALRAYRELQARFSAELAQVE
jgi:hypothetical protein